MDLKELIKTIADRAHSAATVKTIFGDPIVAFDKTIIPIARVAYGFGAGGAQSSNVPSTDGADGGGGGGGVAVMPEGVLEVTPEETRFISIGSRKKMAGALLLGAAVGLLIGQRLR